MCADWEIPAGIPRLTQGEVQIWRIELSGAAIDEVACLNVLSLEERERAGRLRAGQVRMQFLAGRSSLRILLGAHLSVAPVEVPLSAGEYGKPELAPPFKGKVHFNVAHSRSTVLIALSLDASVGIDIEYLDRKTEFEEVARHSLSDRETSILLAIDDIAAKANFFFERWTRKESVVKADGRGLSLPLTSFDIPDIHGTQAVPVTIPSLDRTYPRTYFVRNIELEKGTACAIATADYPERLRFFRFPPTHLVL